MQAVHSGYRGDHLTCPGPSAAPRSCAQAVVLGFSLLVGARSNVRNLMRIRETGTEPWLEAQQGAWRCPECGAGALCVMDRECYNRGYRFMRP